MSALLLLIHFPSPVQEWSAYIRYGIERCQGVVSLAYIRSVGSDLMRSEVTPEGIKETDLGQTLVNGNHIAMVGSYSGA